MKSQRLLRVLRIGVTLAAAQGIALLGYLWVEHDRKAAKEPTFRYEGGANEAAQELVLLRPDGSKQKLTELRGKPVLLHFWATWCPPCKEELPGILELGRELAGAGELQLVALSVDAEWATVRDFFGGEIPREIVRDSAGLAAELYDVSTLPDTYLVGADGSIRLRFSGARDWRTSLARDTLRNELNRNVHE